MGGRRKIELLLFFGIISLGFCFVPKAYAATEVGGIIYSDEHWVATASPYIIKDGVPNANSDGFGVAGGATLTIDPGVVVKFEAGTQFGTGQGKIYAKGTADEPIIFTAINDDSAGGDTNGDGESSSNQGFWNRITLANEEDVFEYVEVRYGTKCIDLNFVSITVQKNKFENCKQGIVSGSNFTGLITNNEFVSNETGVYVSLTDGAEISGNEFSENETGLKMEGNTNRAVDVNANIFHDNDTAIYVDVYPLIKINQNDFENNIDFAINNLRTVVSGQVLSDIDATENWWGDTSGPHHETLNTDGLGDTVNYGIDFDPWEGQQINQSEDSEGEVLGENTTNPNFGSGGSISRTAVHPEIVKFYTVPEEVKEGESFELLWETKNTEHVLISGLGEVDLSGSTPLRADGSSDYKLTALSPGGTVERVLSIKIAPRDPVIIIPGITGSWYGKLDPFFGTYEGLVNGLKSVGYVEGQTLFRFPYEWWNDNRRTATQLSRKVNEILQICGCQKVDIVAHSMGGLISRYYLQQIDDSKVDQIIFLGTPHLGAAKSYLTWEAGEFGTSITDFFRERLFSARAHSLGYRDVVEYIHSRVMTVRQLLPVYKYITDFQTGEFYEYEKCKEGVFLCNEFLEEINHQISDKVRAYNIVENNNQTIRGYVIDREQSREKYWRHGMPTGYPNQNGILYSAGDGTVPINSANWGSHQSQFISNPKSNHGNLPYYAQSEVAEILIGKSTNGLVGPRPSKWYIFIRLGSPAHIKLTDSDGREIGFGANNEIAGYYSDRPDEEFIFIPDPPDDEYKIEVFGTGAGEYELEVASFNQAGPSLQVVNGEAKPGVRDEYVFEHNLNKKSVDLEKKDTSPPKSSITVHDYQAIIQAVDDSEIENIFYSLDSGKSWQVYNDPINFVKPGVYEVLFFAVDEFENREYVNIGLLSLSEEIQKVEKIVNDTEIEFGLSEQSFGDIETEKSGEVLGATKRSDKFSLYLSKYGLVLTILIVFGLLGYLVYKLKNIL